MIERAWVESEGTENISKKQTKLAFQKYNIFKKQRWDTQDMIAEMKNRTSNFNYKNRHQYCIIIVKLYVEI